MNPMVFRYVEGRRNTDPLTVSDMRQMGSAIANRVTVTGDYVDAIDVACDVFNCSRKVALFAFLFFRVKPW